MGTWRRCRPAACQTEQDGAVDLIGLRRLDRPDKARYGDGRGRRRGPDAVLHDADSRYNGAAIQNNTNDSKAISARRLRCCPQTVAQMPAQSLISLRRTDWALTSTIRA